MCGVSLGLMAHGRLTTRYSQRACQRVFLFRGGGGRGVCAVIERERERERGLEPNAENLMANVYDAP